MATIDVKDAADLTVAVEKPLAPGRVAASASRPVVLSTEDKAALDALATALASILAKVVAAPSTEAKQDITNTKLDTLHADLGTTIAAYVDGLEALIGTTNTGNASILAKLIAAPATEAKQDTGNTSLSSIDTKMTTLAGYVDGLEALATLLNTYADGLEALVGTTNTNLTTLQGYVDGLEGLITTLNAKDFATQTTLAAVLAKIIAAPATEAKQDTGNTSLSAIATLLTTQAGYLDGVETALGTLGTQTTLAAVLAKIITAPATEAKQDTLIAKDFATQTTLAAVLAKIIAAPATEAKQDNAITQETATAAALGTTAGAAVVTDAAGTIQQYQRGLVKRWSDALGSGTAAAALRVTLATDGPAVAALGTTTDAAVITDSAGSIQQYLRGLVKRWADALGAGTAAAALRVTHASDDPAVATLGATTGAAVITDANGTIQQYLRGLIKQWIAGTLVVGAGTNKIGTTGQTFFAAVGAVLTRPANTTAYAANDSISDNATAGSVTALPITVSDTNNDPITIERMRLSSTDTGWGGVSVRAWLYNSDPTASSGVVGGDNAAFSNKRAGFIGTLSGVMRGMNDGSVGCVVPDEGSRVITVPGSGAKTLWWQLQTLGTATPSANGTTFTPTVEGFQGRT